VSDRIGRKPVLVLGLLGYGLSALLFGLSTQLWMLFASRALSGVLSSATLSTAMAYVGDTTSEEDRGGGMGWLGAAMAIGAILGPALGGLLGGGSLSMPFFVAAGLSGAALVIALLVLPESLPARARVGVAGEGGDGRGAKDLWQALFGPVGVVYLLLFVVSFALANFESVFGLYAMERHGYGPERVGAILMIMAIASTIGKGALTGPFTRRWGEAVVVRVSTLAGSVGFVVLLLANTYASILLATGFFILSKTLLRPALLAMISKRAGAAQGATMGLSNSLMSLGRIVGPIWAGFAFDIDFNYPYLSGSLVLLIGFLISVVWVSEQGREGCGGEMPPVVGG
jgi:DHA1 family multidrug resistance protein-like MFS transporter